MSAPLRGSAKQTSRATDRQPTREPAASVARQRRPLCCRYPPPRDADPAWPFARSFSFPLAKEIPSATIILGTDSYRSI